MLKIGIFTTWNRLYIPDDKRPRKYMAEWTFDRMVKYVSDELDLLDYETEIKPNDILYFEIASYDGGRKDGEFEEVILNPNK